MAIQFRKISPFKTSTKCIKFNEAYSVLRDTPLLEPPVLSFLKDEIEAVITHWLQDISRQPIGFSVDTHKYWLEILYNKLTESNDPLLFVFPQDLKIIPDFPFIHPKTPVFSFIDLFAGIGGFRIALQNYGGKSVFSSEWDKDAKKTYLRNFGEVPFGDIRNFTNTNISDEQLSELIPDHDILTAGFPCQPFSRAGVSARKSLGISHGFECEIQGTLFFDIVRIAKVKKPYVLLLENVKNLKSHDHGQTFETIRRTITEDLGYSFSSEVIDASVLVPQRRQRCFIVCFRDNQIKFSFPEIKGKLLPLKSILEANPPDKYTISDQMWLGHQKRTARNVARGTGFTAYLANLEKPSNTLVSRYYKDGKECLIPQEGKNPRKLTPRECARLQGFPEKFLLPERDRPTYRQFGNAVPVPVVEKIISKILKDIKKL